MLFVLAALAGFVVVPPALAAPSATTPYPAIVTAAGETLEIQLDVGGSPGERVGLALDGVPDGWRAQLRAGGFNVQAVTVPSSGDGPATATLELTVPPDARKSETITVVASSAAGTDRVPIEVSISETATSAVSLETEFTTLTGAPDDTFTWSVTLNNDVPEETTFQLAASGPEGWQVSATPSSESRANAVTVEGGGTATISVEATPPAGVSGGAYPLLLEVTGGSGRSASLELTAEVTGSPSLGLTTASGRLNAAGPSGEATTIPLVVTNDGSAPARGISLEASPPSDWEVTFEPAQLQALPAGESVQVQARVTPSEDAIVGDYVATFTASAEQGEATSDVRFTVETSGAWGITAIVVILLVVAVLAEVFRRYGRR